MNKILATIIAVTLYQTNHVLRFLVDLTVSENLDHLSTRYLQWYNKYLISAVINYSGIKKGKLQSIKTRSIETVDTLLIAEIEYKGLTLVELSRSIINSLSIISGIKTETIQITKQGAGQVKIIFPMLS